MIPKPYPRRQRYAPRLGVAVVVVVIAAAWVGLIYAVADFASSYPTGAP